MKKILLLVCCISQTFLFADLPYPIGFGVPETKIVRSIPQKDRDFAYLIPGDMTTYIYTEESSYYKAYQRSYFAITCKKGGWDCLRHYEILANGCIPYFINLENCDDNTMHLLPRELIHEAMNLPGVSKLHIDHEKFDRKRYYEILNELLAYTREHLTTKSIAKYLLDTINYKGQGKILYLSNDPSPDYMRCLILTGLKELFGDRVVDVPKIEHIYTSYPRDINQLYGRGMTYTKNIPDLPLDRDNLEQRIANKEFDLVIYGSVHRGLRYIDLVKQNYGKDKIAYICGEDFHSCEFSHLPNFFLREFEACQP